MDVQCVMHREWIQASLHTLITKECLLLWVRSFILVPAATQIVKGGAFSIVVLRALLEKPKMETKTHKAPH